MVNGMPKVPTLPSATKSVTVGILGESPADHGTWRLIHAKFIALQGAFAEHQIALSGLSLPITIVAVLVRTVDELDACDALIIPGGGTGKTSRVVMSGLTGRCM